MEVDRGSDAISAALAVVTIVMLLLLACPLAWQSQLAAELRALLESELLRRAGAAMDETRWALYAPEVFTSKLKVLAWNMAVGTKATVVVSHS